MPFLRRRQSFDHETNHANAYHGLAMFKPDFVVTTEAPRFDKPAEGSFYDPALGKHFEPFGVVATPHDFQTQLSKGLLLLDPPHQRSQVAAIGPDDLQPPEHLHQALDQSLGGVPVLHGGAGNHDGQHQAQGVHRHMALASLDLFARVVAAFSGLVRGFDRLTVNNCCRRRHVAPLGFAQPVSHGVMDEGPGPILAPVAKVTIDGLPRPVLLGQIAPRAARSVHIKDSIDQGATFQFEGATALSFAGFGQGNQRLDLVPFFIGEVTWVIDWMRMHPIHLYPKRYEYNFNVITD